MKTVRSVAEVRAHVGAARRAGRSIGLVPTMGAFHDGHLSLMRAAREECDEVVVWLFVNPAQFNEAADLAAYPRDEAADARMAEAEGVDVLFAPPLDEVYPAGFSTTVNVAGLGDRLEGAHRPGHFAGVATVVTKMLNMVAPDVAYFGAKDAQQVALVRRLVADLDIPVRIEALPIVREPDGLAMSSRNAHLGAGDRERAVALIRGLRAAERAAAEGERDVERLRAAVERELADVEPEYLALVDPETLTPVATVDQEALLAVAARVGEVRLIDNTILSPNGTGRH